MMGGRRAGLTASSRASCRIRVIYLRFGAVNVAMVLLWLVLCGDWRDLVTLGAERQEEEGG
jgi:hypothetical protein